MTFRYHRDSDMLYIELAQGTGADSTEVAPGVVVDFDDSNRIIGIEIEDASQRVDLSRLELQALPLSNLLLTEPRSA